MFPFVLKIRLDVDHPDVCKGEIRSIDSSDCKLIDSNKHHELILAYNRRRYYIIESMIYIGSGEVVYRLPGPVLSLIFLWFLEYQIPLSFFVCSDIFFKNRKLKNLQKKFVNFGVHIFHDLIKLKKFS